MIRSLLLFFLLLSACSKQPSPAQKSWQTFKQEFISTEGRVIDNGNKGISHSEGQGYGLLFAVYFNDQKTFATLWDWSVTHLQTRNDYLFSWQYTPNQGVTDVNNASDGDILIAWALLQAAQRWHNSSYQQAANNILRDIRNKLIKNWQGHKIIMPAEQGFITQPGKLTINLSYWVFPALQEFARVDKSPLWQKLINSGLYLFNTAEFGQWQLPADWLQLDDKTTLSSERPPVFGYEAIRIPLYLSWANLLPSEKRKQFLAYAQASQNQLGYLSPKANLLNNSFAEYPANAGFISTYQLIAQKPIGLANISQNKDYYSHSLELLAFIAQQQSIAQ